MINRVTWPLLSYKHDDLATFFADRMERDKCNYTLTYNIDFSSQKITGVTVSAPSVGNNCSAPIPITVPGGLRGSRERNREWTEEQVGNDPLTAWVSLVGKSVDLELKDPISW